MTSMNHVEEQAMEETKGRRLWLHTFTSECNLEQFYYSKFSRVYGEDTGNDDKVGVGKVKQFCILGSNMWTSTEV